MDCRRLAPGFWLGAFSFAVMVTLVPGIAAPATTPRWALLSAVVPFLASFSLPTKFDVAHALGALFLGWCAITLAWTPNLWDGLDALWKLVLFAGLFCIGAALRDLRPVWIGAALGIGVSSALAIGQLFGVELVERIEGPTGMAAGLFMNKNFLAEPAALVLIGLVWHRLWWLVPLVLPAVVLPGARGALLALAVAGIVALRGWWRVYAGALAALAVVACVVLAKNGSFPERMIIWTSTLDGLTWLGNGIGSFYALFPSHAPAWDFLTSRPVHAHNDWLELAYDLGLPGILMLLGAFYCALRAEGPDRLVLIAFITEGCLGFPLHFPATVFLAALVAGRLCGDRAPLRDVLTRWGIRLCDGLERRAVALGARPSCSPRRFGVPARPTA